MIQVAISLGSNLGNRKENIEKAIEFLDKSGIHILAVSSFYETVPDGFNSDNLFTNAAAIAETNLEADELVNLVLSIESHLGRIRNSATYEDRIIDVDVLLYGSDVIETAVSQIPHPRMHLRRFVLEPLSEIAPNWVHPILKRTIFSMLK